MKATVLVLAALALVGAFAAAAPVAAADVGVGVPLCDLDGHCKCFNFWLDAPGKDVDRTCGLPG